MAVGRTGASVPAGRLRPPAAWCCVLAVLAAIAAGGAGLRHVYAQTEEPATAPPAQSETSGSEKPPAASDDPASTAPAPAAEPRSATAGNPEDLRKQEVANECHNLLKMASDLKAEVDKTTKDELSISVVRKAGEIEQFARRVRTDPRLTAGKD